MAKKRKGTPAKPTQPKPEKSKGRKDFELVGNKDEEVYPFSEAMPEGYDFKLHKPLKRRDFQNDSLYYEYRALDMERKADGFRVLAEEAKKLGSRKDRAKARRLVKMQEKMEELKKQLENQGIDVESLLAEQEEEAA